MHNNISLGELVRVVIKIGSTLFQVLVVLVYDVLKL